MRGKLQEKYHDDYFFRWGNQGVNEEWSGGWGNTTEQQQPVDQGDTRGHAQEASEDNSRWAADQYANEYKEQYSYSAGYNIPKDQTYDRYRKITKC